MIRKFLVTAALLALAPSAFAATCSVDIEGNDAMKYDVANIDISKSCKTFTINLKHTGQLAKNILGHNVVLAKTADMKAIHAEGMQAGPASDSITPSESLVVASSKVIRGGASTPSTAHGPLRGELHPFFTRSPSH